MDIITSNLINSEYDALWEDITPLVKDAAPRPLLRLINTYTQEASENAQLVKMLEACKLVPEQYNIIQINKSQQVAWHKLREQLDPKIIFLIGILPAQLGISSLFRINAPNRFNDRIWLPTLSINELEQRPDIKKQLWQDGMKPVLVDKSYGEF